MTIPDSLQPQDLMTAVRKTNFDNEELQDLIDILLNKQQNSPMVQNGSWVDPQTNEMKQLQRALEESGKALEFEQVYIIGDILRIFGIGSRLFCLCFDSQCF